MIALIVIGFVVAIISFFGGLVDLMHFVRDLRKMAKEKT